MGLVSEVKDEQIQIYKMRRGGRVGMTLRTQIVLSV